MRINGPPGTFGKKNSKNLIELAKTDQFYYIIFL